MEIEIWSDIACPWCLIGKVRFERALAAFAHRDEVRVRWRSYQLDPSLPDHYDGTEMDNLAARKGLAVGEVRQMFDRVAQVGAGEGIHFDFERVVVANSARAHELMHLAHTAGVADEVNDRLLRGHFEQGRDIGSVDYLVEVGVACGVDEAEIRAVLGDRRYAADVQTDVDTGISLGLRGVPFFVIDRAFGISGAQATEAFAQALEQAWVAAHPLVDLGASAEGDADSGVCGPDGCAI